MTNPPLLPMQSDPNSKPWFLRDFVAVWVLLAATIIPYLNSLHVPWYFDDTNNIVDNPLIRHLPQALPLLLQNRGVALFSFALNYHWGWLDPFGYHLVNLAIHAGCALMVWLLLRRLLSGDAPWPLAGALLFVLHPVQTQAVTYVVQRMTSLSALFFLAALYGYLAYGDASGRRRQLWYGLALVSGALAVLTKENAAVLPVVLLLAERYFRPERSWREQLQALWPFCVVPALLAAKMLLVPLWQGDVASSIRYADQLQSLQNVTPWRYLATEFSVLWYYIRLLVAPIGQMLDYGWPVVGSVLNLQSLAALAGLGGLAWLAWVLRQRRPLVSFGIAWFFVTLSVESSIIPLDPIFEHRLYLPMFGFVLVILDLLRRLPWRAGQMPLLAVVLLVLALLTWQRNALWADPLAFFEDNLRRSPGNVRVMVMLGNAYAAKGRPDDGLRTIRGAMALNPRYDFAYTALGKILIDLGQGATAIPALQQGLQYYPDSVTLNEYLGIAYGEAGEFRKALAIFERLATLKPDDASIFTNIGVIHSRLGNDRQAAAYFERSLRLVPDSEKTLFNYASTLYALGEKQRAFEALRAVLRANPANVDALYGVGSLAVEFGRRQEAVAARDALLRLGDGRARDLDELLSR